MYVYDRKMSRDFFRSWRLYKDSSSSGEVVRHSAQEQWELVTLEMESWRRDETDGVEVGVEVEVEVEVEAAWTSQQSQ